ncbi:uncharacterized protein RJT21DRAFT_37556 [Scheffersomyces amazonensis]|uniref:uncharacterized protein n=1 Tax=Scheffersomyces amazonensis TaxID=1078765 RepID=UPI00315CDDFA
MTIEEDVTFLFNGFNFNMHGNFLNKGIFYVRNIGTWPNYAPGHKTGMTFNINNGDSQYSIDNYGTIVINDNTTTCSPPSYYWASKDFYNEGNITFAGSQICDGATFQIKPTGSFVNKGVISYVQYYMTTFNPPSTYFGSRSGCDTGAPTTINNGTFCLVNNNALFQMSQYSGNGCIDVGEQSTFALLCSQLYGIDGNLQTIYLSSNTSVLDIYSIRNPASQI